MRASSLMLLASFALAACGGGKPPEEPAPEPAPAPAPPPAPAPVDDSAERERLERERMERDAAERARALAAELGTMINFEFDKADIRSADQGPLDRKAAILAANSNVRIRIAGHADDRQPRGRRKRRRRIRAPPLTRDTPLMLPIVYRLGNEGCPPLAEYSG